MIKKAITLVLLFASGLLSAQDQSPQMADDFRQQGKIYVVITVIGVIFLSLIVMMVSIERRISKMEKRINGNNDAHK